MRRSAGTRKRARSRCTIANRRAVVRLSAARCGVACLEGEWVYMHRGLGIPGRVTADVNGEITAPATDESLHARVHQYIKEWKRLMKASPNLAVEREP
jgi:hypothetical protein